MKIDLRRAEPQDCKRIWRWRNEKEVRKVSLHFQKIPFPAHKIWFEKRLESSENRMLIGVNGRKKPFGCVRLDHLRKGTAEIHIFLKKSSRGKGLGRVLLHQACRYGFQRLRLKKIIAHIKPDNPRSLRVFEKVGFELQGTRRVRHVKLLRFMFENNEDE